jgi:predicted nuclease of restriction endonuclease-like (RecB) superfamily
LYQRQAGKPRIDNFAERLPSPGSDLASETLKDPYVFDFLDLGEDVQERELVRGLVAHLTRFMLELRKGFAWAANITWKSGRRISTSIFSSTI